MAKRSVLFINDSLWSGSGVFRSLQQVLRAVSPERFSVTLFICPDATVEREIREQFPAELTVIVGEDRSHYYRRPDVAALHLLSRVASLLKCKNAAEQLQKRTRRRIHQKKMKYPAKRYFRGQSFDVVVANTVPQCAEIARDINAEKKYAVFHSSQAGFFPAETQMALRRFNGVIAVSDGVAEVLKKTYPADADKVLTITNYVDADAIRVKAAAEPQTFPEDRLVLCSCGRLSREKGFDLAVEAARLLKERQLAFVWYFVGDGDQKQALDAMITECHLNDHIVITGFLQNPYPYIAGCDIYVQPSYEEAQPLAVMEAAALGKATVSTETVGGKTILENGKKGVLTPITAEGLAEGILRLADDPALRRFYEDRYTREDNLREQRDFAAAWDRLLSE